MRNSPVSQRRPVKAQQPQTPRILVTRFVARFYDASGCRMPNLKVQATSYVRCNMLAQATVRTLADNGNIVTFKIIGVEAR